MNLLLVDQVRDSYWVLPGDPRFESVVRLGEEKICLGVVNGPRGIGKIIRTAKKGVEIGDVCWEAETWEPPVIDLVVGLPRPAEVRRILLQATTIGIRSLTFAALDRTPPGYLQSRALESESIDRLLREALEQGFHTARPEVRIKEGLDSFLECVDPERPPTVLDPYLGDHLLGEEPSEPVVPWMIIMGSERGFSPREQDLIRSSGARVSHLGPSILRTETALVAALTLAHRKLGHSARADRSVIRPNAAGSC